MVLIVGIENNRALYYHKNRTIEKAVTNHTLLALNPKTQFSLPDRNDNVLVEKIEWNSKSNQERKRGSLFRVLMSSRGRISSASLVKNNC